jgi:hypothetical protein
MTVRRQGRLGASLGRLVAAPVALLLLPAPLFAQVHDHSGPLPDNIPDFCATPTISSVRSGNWSDPATWSAGRVPAAGDVVDIAAATDVSYGVVSDASVGCLAVNGRLAFRTDISTRLTVGTMIVMPGGELNVGTADNPVSAAVTAEIVIANQPINLTTDPEQYGTGLLGFGVVRMHGAPRTRTWVRLAQEPRAGQTTLTLSEPVSGWRAGDRLILPDTRHLKWNEVSNWMRISAQREELTVQSISADGRAVTLGQALRFDHLGARDGSGALRLLPHLGNLTRNVVVRSQAPIGTAGVQGHVIMTDRADVDIRYALFRDLGRTIAAPTGASNQIGRYPVHFHHLAGPAATPANGCQYTFIGNAVDGGSTPHKKRCHFRAYRIDERCRRPGHRGSGRGSAATTASAVHIQRVAAAPVVRQVGRHRHHRGDDRGRLYVERHALGDVDHNHVGEQRQRPGDDQLLGVLEQRERLAQGDHHCWR